MSWGHLNEGRRTWRHTILLRMRVRAVEPTGMDSSPSPRHAGDPAVVRDLASRGTQAMGAGHITVTVEQLMEV